VDHVVELIAPSAYRFIRCAPDPSHCHAPMDLIFDDDEEWTTATKVKVAPVVAAVRRPAAATAPTQAKVVQKKVLKVSTKAMKKKPKAMSTSSVVRGMRVTMMARAAHQAKVPNRSGLVETGKLTLGSDCSGIGMDYLALKFSGLPLPIDTAFCSEVDDNKKRLLAIMHEGSPIRVMYNDIAERDNSEAPEVDLFVSGAPCQAFSSAGKRLGAGEARGLVILHSLNYVIEKLPSVVVFENVAGLLHRKHKAVFRTINLVLKTLGYNVSHKLVNTKDHGIPQSRPRVYIIGTDRGGSNKMVWPREVPCVGVEYFLQLKHVPFKLQHLSPTATRNVKAAKKRWSKDFKDRGTRRHGPEMAKASCRPI